MTLSNRNLRFGIFHKIRDTTEHDGDRAGRLSGSLHLSRRDREDDVDLQADEIGHQLAQPFGRLSVSK
jgi:hypothetical protein